jgi:hypothetical protein
VDGRDKPGHDESNNVRMNMGQRSGRCAAIIFQKHRKIANPVEPDFSAPA